MNNVWRERFLKRSFLILMMLSLIFIGQKKDDLAFCDTELTKEQIEYELSRKKLPIKFENEKLYVLSIRAHIVRKNNGEGGISEERVLESVEMLNRHFNHTKIGFEICTFNYIDKTHLFNFNKMYEKELVRHDADSTINIYFVDKISSAGDGNVCGYTYYPTKNQNHIILSNSCVANNTSLTHEMGHFFGLYHTHEEKFGVELVNGANCVVAGDLVCDTPADPGLTGNMINTNCEYLGYLMDPVKSIYNPPVDNFMSYTRKECRSIFSPEQSRKMRENYALFKSSIKKVNIKLSVSDTLIFKGETLTLDAAGGTKYFWSTGDSTSTVKVNPDTTTTYSVNIYTPDGCNVYKRKRIEVFHEPVIEVPAFRCTRSIDTLKVIASSKNLKYQLSFQNTSVSDTLAGNDSTLIFVMPEVQKRTDYKLLIYREKLRDTFKIEKRIIIPLVPKPDSAQEVVPSELPICEGERGQILIPQSEPFVNYQLIADGELVGTSYGGNGDSLYLFTDPLFDSASYDLLISNKCGESLIKNVASFAPIENVESKIIMNNLKRELIRGESASFMLLNSQRDLIYQLYVNNQRRGFSMKGSGGTITFQTGPLNANADICVFASSSAGCGGFLESQFHLQVLDPPQVRLNEETQNSLEVTFTLQNNSNVQIQVFDLLGKSLVDNNFFFTEGSHTLDFSDMKKGRYYIKILAGDKILFNKIVNVK